MHPHTACGDASWRWASQGTWSLTECRFALPCAAACISLARRTLSPSKATAAPNVVGAESRKRAEALIVSPIMEGGISFARKVGSRAYEFLRHTKRSCVGVSPAGRNGESRECMPCMRARRGFFCEKVNYETLAHNDLHAGAVLRKPPVASSPSFSDVIVVRTHTARGRSRRCASLSLGQGCAYCQSLRVG